MSRSEPGTITGADWARALRAARERRRMSAERLRAHALRWQRLSNEEKLAEVERGLRAWLRRGEGRAP